MLQYVFIQKKELTNAFQTIQIHFSLYTYLP